MSWGVGHRCGSDLAWLWCRLAAAPQIQPLAWELPHGAGVVLKRKKENQSIPCNSMRHPPPQGRQGWLFQRYLFGSKHPSFSLCSSPFLKRPLATSSLFQPACGKASEHRYSRGKRETRQLGAGPRRGLGKRPPGNWKEGHGLEAWILSCRLQVTPS